MASEPFSLSGLVRRVVGRGGGAASSRKGLPIGQQSTRTRCPHRIPTDLLSYPTTIVLST